MHMGTMLFPKPTHKRERLSSDFLGFQVDKESDFGEHARDMPVGTINVVIGRIHHHTI